jgi:hypothetical protein
MFDYGPNIRTAAGLQIARWKLPAPISSQSTADEKWRKIMRSLIFMDSWLSYTLGYITEVTTSDVQVNCESTYHLDFPDTSSSLV